MNLSRLLLTLDTDGDPSNGITIDAATHTAAAGLSVTDFHDTATFETEVAPLVGAGLVSASQAAAHLQDSLKALNGHASLTLIGRYADNQALAQGIAEIVAFHNASHSIMVINTMDATVDILDASGLTSTALANPMRPPI